jgi:AraC-like DNA-binding protein
MCHTLLDSHGIWSRYKGQQKVTPSVEPREMELDQPFSKTPVESIMDVASGHSTRIVVHTETPHTWLKSPASVPHTSEASSSAMLSRWEAQRVGGPIDLISTGGDETHTLTLCLKATRGEIECGGKWVHQGTFHTNSLWIKAPYEGARALYFNDYGVFRVHLPQALIRECYAEAYGQCPDGDVVLSNSGSCNDSILNNLVQMLVRIDDVENITAQTFVDGVSLAMVSRLIALNARRNSIPRNRNNAMPLAQWRLKRVMEYIDSNLSTNISLAQLSDIAGLSRMYFAAQFRAATGSSPHQYILHRKIERAKRLLSNPTSSIIDVASVLGFRTQAHFTLIFRGIVGETPARWRQGSYQSKIGSARDQSTRKEHLDKKASR